MRITDTCSEWIWFLGIVGLGAFVTLRWVKESVLVVVNNG